MTDSKYFAFLYGRENATMNDVKLKPKMWWYVTAIAKSTGYVWRSSAQRTCVLAANLLEDTIGNELHLWRNVKIIGVRHE